MTQSQVMPNYASLTNIIALAVTILRWGQLNWHGISFVHIACTKSATARRNFIMYLARFSYDVLPANRQKAIEFIRREVAAAREKGLTAKLLVPITRGQGGAALQFELELVSLDQLDQFRQRGVRSDEETSDWMHAFSEILLAPPVVELLRLDGTA